MRPACNALGRIVLSACIKKEPMPAHTYLSQPWTPADVHHCIGLVADTHMPKRLKSIPPALFAVLEGVDLVLHAGDVGELWVLDQLSRIAPVVAVHGNDETAAAQRELPYQQLVSLAGRRILLWHSHFPDWQDEVAARQSDELLPKLQRSVARGRAASAQVVVFGHWHIPLVYRADDVLVINPGALASGNEISHQLIQSVALLFLLKNGTWEVAHVNLAAPDRIFVPPVQWANGFRAALDQVSTSILDPRLSAAVPYLRANLPPAEFELLSQLVMELGRRCKAGPFPMVTADVLALAVEQSDDLLPATRALAPSFLRSQVDGGGLDFPSSAALGNDGEPEDHGAAQPVDRPRQRED